MINKLILGTVQLGLDYGINNQFGKPSVTEAFEILNCAYDNGIRILDTAEAYGNSQEVIGAFHKKHPNKSFKIITKLASTHSLKKNKVIDNIETDCKILEVSKLHGYMFHNFDSFKKNESFYEELLKAKSKGLIDKAGISLYKNEELEEIIEKYSEFDFVQIPFNLLDNASKRQTILKKAKANGMEVHTRSVFLQGLFFKNKNMLPESLLGLKEHLSILDTLKLKNDISTDALALQYTLQKEYIDYVLIGVEDASQLISNINTCKENKKIPHSIIDGIHVKDIRLLNPSNW